MADEKAVFETLSHSFDPLGQTYDALLGSTVIQEISIGQLIAKEIMTYIPYIESTLWCEYAHSTSGFWSYSNDDEIAHLITMPSKCKHDYILKSFKFYCGSPQNEIAEISLRIGIFEQYNKRIDFDNLLYKSPKNIVIDGHRFYEVENINATLKAGQMYMIEPYCAKGNGNIVSGRFQDCQMTDFENLTFVRSDLRWNGWESGREHYHFRYHVKRFECVFALRL